MGLSLVHNSMPTHYDISHNCTSLLDYFLVSMPELVELSDQFQCPGLTRHSCIFLSLGILQPVNRQYYEFYDYDAVDIGFFKAVADGSNLNDIFLTNSVDEQLEILNNTFQLLHSIVPLKTRMIRNRYNGWMKDPVIGYYLSLRDLAYGAYLRLRTDENWRVFCRCRNRAKSIIRKFKRRAHSALFDGKDSREIWSVLGRSGVTNDIRDFGDIDPDYFNNIFSSNQLIDGRDSSTSFLDYGNGGFSFRSVDILEMFEAFGMIKSKAVGCDGLRLKFIGLLMPIIGAYVLHLVNTILTTSTFPLLWKVARIVPLKKANSLNGADDFRPISILPILAKMVEHLLKSQLVKHIDDNQLLHDCQSGFRCNRSTTSLLLGVTDNIRRCISDRGICILLSLDLTKAFDRVNHSILLEKLKGFYDFSGSACRLISSYLSDRRQFVFSSGRTSGLLPVYSGVPQGSVLGPLLFIMFLNDLFCRLSSNMCLPFSFADDVQLLFKGSVEFPDVLQNMVDYTVELLLGWIADSGLSVNAGKTKAMLFSKGSTYDFSVTLGSDTIEFVDKLKCLGVILDRNLSFEGHVNAIVSKVTLTLRKLYSLDMVLPFYIRKRVVHGILMPIFLYGLEVYSGTFGYVMGRLKLAFNRVVRYLYSLRRSQHVSEYVLEFLKLPFAEFIKFRNLLHFYKSYKLHAPIYLVDLFQFCRSDRNRQIVIPRLTSILERSFFVRVARVYNNLPRSLKTFNFSYAVFRTKLFQVLSSNSSS